MPRAKPIEQGRRLPSDVTLGAVMALFALALQAVAGFPTLQAALGDNDSLLRLVEVRDLIGGQGWFDLHQYRMGPDGGIVMHWSRLVDAPIAALVLGATALTGSTTLGETVALIAWPALLMTLAMAMIVRIARTLGDHWAVLPALTIGGTALYFIGIFTPGSIDHHNVQLVLALATLAALATGRGFFAGLAAGIASAAMLAIGMEALPYVAVAGLVSALAFMIGGDDATMRARGFGTGFTACAALAFVATVPASDWFAEQCDAYSLPQFTIALVAGIGLMGVTSLPVLRQTLLARAASLAAVGVAVALVTIAAFPQCIAAPYGALDDRFQAFHMAAITEAQPIWSILANDPAMAAAYYVTPLIALVVLGWRLVREGITGPAFAVAAFLGAAFAVSLWQVRGGMFAVPLAAIPLAAWAGSWRQRAAGDSRAALRMALAWLLSLNTAWGFSTGALAGMMGSQSSLGEAQSAGGSCDRPRDFATLAALPRGNVLAISNLGAPLLAHTHHRALAAPYHRNVGGDLSALDAFAASNPSASEKIIRDNRIDFVAICHGNDETKLLLALAPTGFLASLVGGSTPSWLEKLPDEAGQALEIYRVRPLH